MGCVIFAIRHCKDKKYQTITLISLVHGTRISNEAVSIPNMTARGRARMKYGAFVHLKMCPKQSPDERQQASDLHYLMLKLVDVWVVVRVRCFFDDRLRGFLNHRTQHLEYKDTAYGSNKCPFCNELLSYLPKQKVGPVYFL